MADTFSNVTGNTYLADLGITVRPTPVYHSDVWRPHPMLDYIPVIVTERGITGNEIQVMADISSILSFAENTALTDQAMPAITGFAPTLVGRGYSWSQSVQGRQRVADRDWPQFELVRAQKVVRAMVDDLTHGSTNSFTLLSAGITDITVDAAGNATLDGLLMAVQAVGRPAVAFYDAIGIQGLIESIRSEGAYYASEGVSEQVRRLVDKYTPDQIHPDGFVFEVFGCKVFQTNNKSGDATRLYENSSITHAIVMADHKRRAQAAKGNPMAQYDLVPPPFVLHGREDPIPDMPKVHDPQEILSLKGGAEMPNVVGMNGRILLKSWLDLGNNVAGLKRDFGWEFDPILVTSGDVRCHQYLTTFQ